MARRERRCGYLYDRSCARPQIVAASTIRLLSLGNDGGLGVEEYMNFSILTVVIPIHSFLLHKVLAVRGWPRLLMASKYLREREGEGEICIRTCPVCEELLPKRLLLASAAP